MVLYSKLPKKGTDRRAIIADPDHTAHGAVKSESTQSAIPSVQGQKRNMCVSGNISKNRVGRSLLNFYFFLKFYHFP